MSKRKWLLIAILLPCAIAVGLIVVLRLVAADGNINEAVARRIRPGMTEGQVAALIGIAADERRKTALADADHVKTDAMLRLMNQVLIERQQKDPDAKPREGPPAWSKKAWSGKHGSIAVVFGEDGRAILCNYVPFGEPPLAVRIQSWCNGLLDKLGF